MKLLLENGAGVNAAGGYFGNALQAASYQGNKAIVKLLLENGAGVNAEGGYFGNALQARLSKVQSWTSWTQVRSGPDLNSRSRSRW